MREFETFKLDTRGLDEELPAVSDAALRTMTPNLQLLPVLSSLHLCPGFEVFSACRRLLRIVPQEEAADLRDLHHDLQ